MPFKEKSAFCSACDKQVLVRKQVPNHVLHFLITFFTCGLWIFVWPLIALKKAGDEWLCTLCGRPAISQSAYEASLSHQPQSDSSDMFGQVSSYNNSIFKVAACVFGGLFVVGLIGGLLTRKPETTSATGRSNNSRSSSTSSLTSPKPIPDTNSPDFQAGYKKAFQEGKAWAKKGWEMPLPIGVAGMAHNRADDVKPTDRTAWMQGFEDGFRKGFTSIKKITRKDENYEQLSWSNAKLRVKLYGYDEKHDVTIVGVNRGAGLITVKYVKGGTVEDKRLDAVAQFWWVRKGTPIQVQ